MWQLSKLKTKWLSETLWFCAGCTGSDWIRWTVSWRRLRLGEQQNTLIPWKFCVRTCRSAPRWQVTYQNKIQAQILPTCGFVPSFLTCCLSLSTPGIYRQLCLESVKNKYDCEIQAACQHWEVRHKVILTTLCFKNTTVKNLLPFTQERKPGSQQATIFLVK